MKFFTIFVFLCAGFALNGQTIFPSGINGSSPIIDTMREDFPGDWYLSGVSYYQQTDQNSNDIYKTTDYTYRMRITKDSLIFYSPPERFYKFTPDGYKYDLLSFHPGFGCEIVAYTQHKKKRTDAARYTIKYNGKELRLVESLSSSTFGAMNIESCSFFKPFVDSIHLDEKLLGTWESSRLREPQFQVQDTMTLYKTTCERDYFSGIQLTFEVRKGTFEGKMTRSFTLTTSQGKTAGNLSQGIVAGVYITDIGNCYIDHKTQQLVIRNKYDEYIFSIISCTEEKITLVMIENKSILPEKR